MLKRSVGQAGSFLRETVRNVFGDMLQAPRSGAARETADISKWMQSYLVLKNLIGTHTAGMAYTPIPPPERAMDNSKYITDMA